MSSIFILIASQQMAAIVNFSSIQEKENLVNLFG